MLFKGNSSRLELLIEKIQANKENHHDIRDALGTDPGSSWRSETPEDATSPSPSSCATPNSATDVPDAELTFTVGVTEGTPYACQFCDKAFPRLSYLKKHEQTHSDQMPFRCEFCSRLFKHKRSRDRHIKLHTGDKKYRCVHCEAAFSRSDHLKIHMKTHDTQKPFQCSVCNRGYNTAAALTSHMQNHKKESAHAHAQLNGHHQQHSGGSSSANTPSPPAFRCLQCGDSFRKPDDLQGHMLTQHRLDDSSTGAGALARGLLGGLMLGDSPFPAPKLACIYCTKDSFSTMEALQLHVHAMHGSILNGELREFPGAPPPLPSRPAASPGPLLLPLACELCTMRFQSPSALHKHGLAVHGVAQEEALAFRGALVPEQLRPTDLSKKARQHSASHDPPAKRSKAADPPDAPNLVSQYEHPGTLLCNQCGAALPDFESFRTHLKSHLEEAGVGLPPSTPPAVASVTCPHCGAQLEDAQALERHVASHFMATATEYGCQSCLKLFAKPDELQKHLMDIHAHHLYRCSLCKEMFDSKVAIQVHFAVKHSNECKLFRCTACPSPSAVFRSEMDFGLHVRSTHGKAATALPPSPAPPHSQSHTHTQPLRCLFCRLSFGTELEMQFHLAAHSKQFHCPLCHEAFHVEFLLDKHLQSHHSSQVLTSNGPTAAENLSQQQKSPKSKTSSSTVGSSAPVTSSNTIDKKGDSSNSNGNCCCEICDRCDFGSEAELVAHRKLVHHIKPAAGKNGAVSLHCAYCSENCKSRTELENHMKTHSQGTGGSGKHKCNICDELCPSAAVLAEHKLTHCKVVSGSACTQCKAALVSEEQFYTHLQQHSNSNSGGSNSSGQGSQQVVLPTPCVVCRQTLISDIEVRMHARFHLKNSALTAGEPLYQCCLCLKQVDPQNLVVTNGANVCQDCYVCHSKGSPEHAFRCADCQLKCESSAALEAHLVNVHRKTYQCIKCQVSFETEREVQAHVATHLRTEGSAHECRLCRRLLATPLKLQAHLIEHTFAGCGSFTCYLCSAVFTAAQGLQAHMLEHGLAARPYDCSRCSLRFFFRAELDNHSYTHLEEAGELANKMAYYQHLNNNGSYESSTSDMHYYKSTAQESSTKHSKQKKQHSTKGNSMFKCLECNKELSSALGLQAHQRHHKHGKKVHSCPECGKDFALARNLSAHMRSHHGDHTTDGEGLSSHLRSHLRPHHGDTVAEGEHLHLRPHHADPAGEGERLGMNMLMHHVDPEEHLRPHLDDHLSERLTVKQEPLAVKEEVHSDEHAAVSSPAGPPDRQQYGSSRSSSGSDRSEDDASNHESPSCHLKRMPSPLSQAANGSIEDCNNSSLRESETVL